MIGRPAFACTPEWRRPTLAHQRTGRSIIAKNKEDTVIIAASSPTIIQKESADGSGAGALAATPSSVGPPNPLAGVIGPLGAGGTAAAALGELTGASDVAELAYAEQSLYETVRNPLAPLTSSTTSVLALAAAAAVDPAPNSCASSAGPQLPTVATQLTNSTVDAILAGQQPAHAPLSSSGTIKQATGGSNSQQPGAGASVSSPRKSNPSVSGEFGPNPMEPFAPVEPFFK